MALTPMTPLQGTRSPRETTKLCDFKVNKIIFSAAQAFAFSVSLTVPASAEISCFNVEDSKEGTVLTGEVVLSKLTADFALTGEKAGTKFIGLVLDKPVCMTECTKYESSTSDKCEIHETKVIPGKVLRLGVPLNTKWIGYHVKVTGVGTFSEEFDFDPKNVIEIETANAEATSNEPVEKNMPHPICETFTVKDVSRVPPGDEPSGAESSALSFTRRSRIFGADNNGWINTPYSRIPALERSRPGDRVLVCLVKYYAGCPKGDDRGRTYKVRNLRTGEIFEAMNGSHICGGA